VNEGEAGRGEHRLGQAGDAADHIQADADRAAELASSVMSCAISPGVLASLRSIRTTPSASIAVTQCISLAM